MRAAVVILVVGIVALIAALLLVGPPGAERRGPDVPRVEAAAVDGWEISWHAALARADRERRPVLAFFTGSDWCPSCLQLRRDVLDTTRFRAWADTHVVRLEVDFPQRAPQPALVVAQNAALNRHYGIAGYPSVLLLSAEGIELGRSEGPPVDGVEGFISRLEANISGRRP